MTLNNTLEILFQELFLQNALNVLSETSLKDLFLKKETGIGLNFTHSSKQYNNRIHSSTELTPFQPSLKNNEGFVYNNILDNRKNLKPKFQVNDLVRTGDLKRISSKGDTTNWLFKL